ncbi:LOW QUALITY PROTEIN: O-fucosyltransferase 29 [Dioscorea cayenensis subsp. rotundata]|uniref:O-fucosyltransferase family protein n=1 Tax=Dioscorea cayennensis subsp. rotundata TaxID=55577 RepID=A0AB40CR21_DIOCR|nr:LOW QUALITY PROTEIN: O-fucosyltransferase 29 [Dioscorea cayenensis subsp. rotundata]
MLLKKSGFFVPFYWDYKILGREGGMVFGMEKRSDSALLASRKRWAPRSVVLGMMLFALGLISLFAGHVVSDIEWTRIQKAWRSRKGGYSGVVDIWKSEFSNLYYGCSGRGPHFHSAVPERKSNGYLLIATSGGLNQQRTGITDAVVVARILNATLVVPELDHHSFWKDNSDFVNIFDVDWFMSFLSKDVKIVKRIPDKVMRSMEKPPYTMRVPRKSSPEYYLDEVLPILLRRRALQLTKFDYRLANWLGEDLQKLRCRVNYHALRFTRPIETLGQKLITTMRSMTSRFIAVHLRFEPDMLAFSGCYYGGGEKERSELGAIRKRWETLPDLIPEDERSRGRCPLTPHEVGLMLRALGFGNDSYLYVASGEIYGGGKTLQPLKDLFPNFYTKEMLAGDDLKPFLPFASRLAAIDYIVCDESDVFVTNNNGNMAKILAGRRRYMGHKRTIRPNSKKLSSLFKGRDKMNTETFAKKVKSCQKGFMGEPDEMRPGRGDFHEFSSSCICRKSDNRNESSDNPKKLL